MNTTNRARTMRRMLGFAWIGLLCVSCAGCAGLAIDPTYGGGLHVVGRTLTDEACRERKLPLTTHGVLVASVPERSELVAGGVLPGDVITAVNGTATPDYATLVDVLFAAGAEQPLTLALMRDGTVREARVMSGHAMSAATFELNLLFPFNGRPLEYDAQIASGTFLGYSSTIEQANQGVRFFDVSLCDVGVGPDLHGFTLLRSLGYESTPGNWVARLLCFDFGRSTVLLERDGDHDFFITSAGMLERE